MVIVIIIVIYLFLMFKSFGHSTCIHPVKKDQDKSGDASVCVYLERNQIQIESCIWIKISNPLMQKY